MCTTCAVDTSLPFSTAEKCMSNIMDTLVTQICKREALFDILREEGSCISILLGQVLIDHLSLQPSDDVC